MTEALALHHVHRLGLREGWFDQLRKDIAASTGVRFRTVACFEKDALKQKYIMTQNPNHGSSYAHL